MKEVLIETFKIVFGFVIVFNFGLMILMPLMFNMKDFPVWLPCVSYPIGAISMGYLNVQMKKSNKN